MTDKNSLKISDDNHWIVNFLWCSRPSLNIHKKNSFIVLNNKDRENSMVFLKY